MMFKSAHEFANAMTKAFVEADQLHGDNTWCPQWWELYNEIAIPAGGSPMRKGMGFDEVPPSTYEQIYVSFKLAFT